MQFRGGCKLGVCVRTGDWCSLVDVSWVSVSQTGDWCSLEDVSWVSVSKLGTGAC